MKQKILKFIERRLDKNDYILNNIAVTRLSVDDSLKKIKMIRFRNRIYREIIGFINEL